MTEMNIFRILDSGQVMRWHTSPQMNRLNQTNASHTWGVMAIAEFLCPDLCNLNFFRHVLYHDVGEIATGDVSSNVKMRRADLSLILKHEESEAIDKMGVEMPPVTPAQIVLAKLADMFEALWFIIEFCSKSNKVEGWEKSIEKMSELVFDLGLQGYDVFPKIDLTLNQIIRDASITNEFGELLQICPF